MSGPESGDTRSRAGFSVIELIMALTVLAFGVVGLATTTLFITRQLTLAEITTARTAATRSVLERIRATPYDSISSFGSGGDTIGAMVISWTVTSTTPQTTTLGIITLGPGLTTLSGGGPMLSGEVADTLLYTLLRP